MKIQFLQQSTVMQVISFVEKKTKWPDILYREAGGFHLGKSIGVLPMIYIIFLAWFSVLRSPLHIFSSTRIHLRERDSPNFLFLSLFQTTKQY